MSRNSKPSRSSKVFSVLIILGLTVLALIVTIEFGLRVFHQLIPMEVCAADYLIGTYDCQPYFVYDEPIRIGYRYEPGFRLEGMWDPASPFLADAADETAPTDRSDAFWYEFETDEMGFPNSQYEWQQTYDIVIAGDSFTIRTAPQTWIELLGEKSGADILTLGAPSWSTLNEVEAVKLYGLDKNPEWVIVMFFEGNDLINAGQYLERQPSGMSWKAYDLRDASITRRLLTPHLMRYFANRVVEPAEAEPPDYRYPVTASTEVGEIDAVLKDVHLLPLSADYETLANSDEFAATSEALRELKRLVETQNGRLLLVYIPSKEHVLWSRIWDPVDVNNILERTVTVTLSEGDHGRLQYKPPYLSFDEFTAHHNAQEQLMADFAQEAGIDFLNLTPIFWQETIARGELYHYADPHWNQAGNELAAEAIYQFLQQHAAATTTQP